MKKFIIKVSIFITGIIVFLLSLFVLIPENKVNYLYEYHNKLNRLDTLEGSRLILVGGSNLAFSLDSKMVSDSLHINVVNMGLHAGIGLRYMIDSINKYLREGDIVIIMPEYSQFFSIYNGTSEDLTSAFLYSLDKDYELLNLSQKMTIVSGIPNHIWSNFSAKERQEWGYYAYNFDEYGDEIAHRTEKSKHIQVINPIENNIDTYAVRDFSNKIVTIKEKGCEVFLYWPITIYSNYKSQTEAIDKINKELAKYNLYFSIPPDYFVYPDSMAFDTPYHLNGDAAEESAFRMINALRNICKYKVTKS